MAEDTIYLSVHNDGSALLLAIASKGTPRRGDRNVTILDVERVKDEAEAKAWFARLLIERPWEERQ